MRRIEARAIATEIIRSYQGTFYSWGGDDPSGFDCSGLVIEALKSIGILPRQGDWTAGALWTRFSQQKVTTPRDGCLVFWWNTDSTQIIHVEYCLNDEISMGASGGGSRTRTKEDAIRDNAFVKIRPFSSRPHLAGFVDPFMLITP